MAGIVCPPPNSHHALLTIDSNPIDTSTAFPDTAATGHFVPPGCSGTKLPHDPIIVRCANNNTMASIQSLNLQLPTLPLPARKATVFKEMRKPLLSVPVLVDNDCTVTFDKRKVTVKNTKGATILQGDRDTNSPLWLVPINNDVLTHQRLQMRQHRKQRPHSLRRSAQLQQQPTRAPNQQALSAYHQRTLPRLAAYLHACAGYIPPATWIRAINNGWFSTWPGLTAKMVAKHLPKSVPTTMGRLHMTRKNVRTTKKARATVHTPDTKIKADSISSEEYEE